jgi:hypothetical protein
MKAKDTKKYCQVCEFDDIQYWVNYDELEGSTYEHHLAQSDFNTVILDIDIFKSILLQLIFRGIK